MTASPRQPDSVTVFVPTEESELRGLVAEGSGIVGSKVARTGRLRVDFEGDAETFPTFGARVRRAVERHTWTGPDGKRGYPTRACAYVSPDELAAIGRYDTIAKELHIDDSGALREWLDVQKLDEEELAGG